jgi:A/G-specific adenine glycosylase
VPNRLASESPTAPELTPASRAGSLLSWYDRHRRRLPWRAAPGEVADPYRVWLSEIMLQQTTVAAVIPYYEKFVTRFPTLEALAGADLNEVLAAWAGLGYYARARNLHACAQALAASGGFPSDQARLRALPGIGDYTAAAIGAIAFNAPVVPVDGNVERVASRLFAVTEPLPGAKSKLRALAASLGDDPLARARPKDFAQALFDLGATICKPAAPACGLCPLRAGCQGQHAGIATNLPRRAAKSLRPQRHGIAFWLTDPEGGVLLRRRPAQGLLGGMTELPGTPWRAEPWSLAEAFEHAPMRLDWHPAGQVRHGFTHFELTIDLVAATADRIDAPGFVHPITDLAEAALPSVMRKCVALLRPTSTTAPARHPHTTSVPHAR